MVHAGMVSLVARLHHCHDRLQLHGRTQLSSRRHLHLVVAFSVHPLRALINRSLLFSEGASLVVSAQHPIPHGLDHAAWARLLEAKAKTSTTKDKTQS